MLKKVGSHRLLFLQCIIKFCQSEGNWEIEKRPGDCADQDGRGTWLNWADELKRIKAKKWKNGLSLVRHNEQSADIAVFLSQGLQRLCVLTLWEQMRVSRAREHNDASFVCLPSLLSTNQQLCFLLQVWDRLDRQGRRLTACCGNLSQVCGAPLKQPPSCPNCSDTSCTSLHIKKACPVE